MTHKDIYTKFMIEYDKANVTSSYPSLTEYEVATVLDKAYNTLIAQKVTGNNIRRISLEGDTKSISDLQPLIYRDSKEVVKIANTNILESDIPEGFLYFLNGRLVWDNSYTENNETKAKSYDNIRYRSIPVKLVSHDMAERFIASSSNIPWIKTPVCYIEDNKIYTVYDSFKIPELDEDLEVTYIKKPNLFAKDLDSINNQYDISYFNCDIREDYSIRRLFEFECNDTVAEELISLAVIFALENVESQRLNSKLNVRGLEA